MARCKSDNPTTAGLDNSLAMSKQKEGVMLTKNDVTEILTYDPQTDHWEGEDGNWLINFADEIKETRFDLKGEA